MKLTKGMRIKMSAEGLAHYKQCTPNIRRLHDEKCRATVVADSCRDGYTTILRDGLKTPRRYATRFWEPAGEH